MPLARIAFSAPVALPDRPGEQNAPGSVVWSFATTLRARREPSDDLMPREAPLAMPAQPLEWSGLDASAGPMQLRGAAPDIAGRRAFIVLGSLSLGVAGALAMFSALAADGIDPLDSAFLALFFLLFAWISFGFLGTVAGVIALTTGSPLQVDRAVSRLPRQPTAVLLTICNEDLDAVMGRLATMTRSVADLGAAQLFDFFVLSDSKAAVEDAEIAGVTQVRSGTAARVYYRRRVSNEARKPGNIADWVRRFGRAYETMIVLDADSLMTGKAMARLAVAMEEQPELGLLQTIPTIIHGHTFFARWQQFAAAAYGHVASAGLQWWSGTEATFWGHNAIIRVRAFAQSCGLPALSGSEPFGGSIMSHDMVEAALLRRRGWAVQMVTLPGGSYEEFPPTLADHAVRDRRWCQGNLQHLRLLGVDGLHWVNRLQLLMGASSYITSPLWLALLLVGLAQQVAGTNVAAVVPAWLLAATGVLLFGPKIVAWLWLTLDRDLRDRLGGGARATATMMLEIPLSMLVAPIVMVGQTLAIGSILRGRPSGWLTQRREADGLTLGDALRLYRWHMALGAIFFVVAGVSGTATGLWTLPVTVSLLAAPITAMLLSRRDIGAFLANRRLFVSEQVVNPFDSGVRPVVVGA